MLASGFTNAPISQYLLFTLIFFSIATSITDSKHLFYIQIVPHLWPYAQAWRILAWQACYLNSTEVLFAGMTVYHLRIIERLWGPRKFGSFLVSILPYTTILPPLLMASILRPLSLYRFNYLPAGPTALIFAVLAQYHAVIPHVYKYRILTSRPTTPGQLPPSLTFSDKSTTYLLAGQLALSQVPGSLLSAVVGWIIGHAWRRELFPGAMRWRLPRWVIKDKSGGERYEGLRRRLEGEGAAAASASGVEGRVGDEPQRRPIGTQILDQFRGAIR